MLNYSNLWVSRKIYCGSNCQGHLLDGEHREKCNQHKNKQIWDNQQGGDQSWHRWETWHPCLSEVAGLWRKLREVRWRLRVVLVREKCALGYLFSGKQNPNFRLINIRTILVCPFKVHLFRTVSHSLPFWRKRDFGLNIKYNLSDREEYGD